MMVGLAHQICGDSYVTEQKLDGARTEYQTALDTPLLDELFKVQIRSRLEAIAIAEQSPAEKTAYYECATALSAA